MSTTDANDGVGPSPAKRPRKGFRASKGLYFKHVELPGDADGKRRRRTFYGSSPAAVDRQIADAKARGGGSIVPASPTRLAEYAETWPEHAGLPGPAGRALKPTTVETTPGSGSKSHRSSAATRVVAGKRVERIATANTVRHVTRVMHTLFKDATDDGVFFGVNPFAQLGRRGMPKHKAKKGRALTLDEARAFLTRLSRNVSRTNSILSTAG